MANYGDYKHASDYYKAVDEENRQRDNRNRRISSLSSSSSSDSSSGMYSKYNQVSAQMNNAIHKAQNGNLDGAIFDYTSIINSGNAEPDQEKLLYFNRGFAYFKRESYNQAIDDFTKVLQSRPDAYLMRAWSYYYINEFDKAIDDCKSMINLSYKRDVAYRIIALSCSKKGNKEQAIENYKLAADFGDDQARENLINAYGINYTPVPPPIPKSSSSSSSPNTRNSFVSFLFALVCGGGVLLTVVWISLLASGGSIKLSLLPVLGILASGIVSAIIAGRAWRNKKNFVFIIMLVAGIIGWLSLFGLVPNSLKSTFINAQTEQTSGE